MKTLLILQGKEIGTSVLLCLKITLLIVIAGFNIEVKSINTINYDEQSTGKNYRKHYLEMEGTIKHAMYRQFDSNILDSAEITILNSNNNLIGKMHSNSSGLFVLQLALNEKFVIRISKNGYVTKIVKVDTRVSQEKLKRYHLPFEVHMFEFIEGLDVSVLKKPIANVVFNDLLNQFDYNYRYTDEVNDKLRNLYSDFFKLKKNNPLDKSETHGMAKAETCLACSRDMENQTNSGLAEYIVGTNGDDPGHHYYPDEVNANEDLSNTKLVETKKKGTPEDKGISGMNKSECDANCKIYFKIQVLALYGYIPPNADFFKKCGTANEYRQDGLYKYTLGEFKTYESADRMLNLIKAIGYKDAFMVAFINSKRVSIYEAVICKMLQDKNNSIKAIR